MNLKEENGNTSVSQKLQINWTKGNWGTATFLVIAHIAAIVALFFWSWPAIITAIVFYWVAGSLGIGMGYHRLLTHRGYKVPKIVEFVDALPKSGSGKVMWRLLQDQESAR